MPNGKGKLTRVATETGLAFIHATPDMDAYNRAVTKLNELMAPEAEAELDKRWPDADNPWRAAALATRRAEQIIYEAICAACLAAQAVEESERLVGIAMKSRQGM